MSSSVRLFDQTSKIIVLADDLSGAAESAGIAFVHGLSAEVQREFDPTSTAEVIAVDTDTRHLPANRAAERVRQVAKQIVLARPAWIFKKVDSVLRGNVQAEIEAVLEATRQPRAILIPANPSRGRTISQGRYLIDGVPLDQTDFAHDPNHPRRLSDVLTLLGRAGGGSNEIVVPDVESETQLEQFAVQCDSSTLAAGAADFFNVLLRLRCPVQAGEQIASQTIHLEPPAILVCGSPVAWPLRRAACTSAGILTVTSDQQIAADRASSALLLGIGESKPAGSNVKDLSRLAEIAETILAHRPINTLLAEGGATAAAIAQQMGWTRFAVVATAPAGVGVLRPIAPSASLVLIKPGSYPWPTDIWEAFCGCHARTHQPEA